MTITWSPALAPAYRVDDDELPPCLSHLYTPAGGLRIGALVCHLDAGHPISGGPGSKHSGGSPEFPHSWTTEEAKQSALVHWATASETGPLCTVCEFRPQSAGGRCGFCPADLAGDDYEPESEAA